MCSDQQVISQSNTAAFALWQQFSHRIKKYNSYDSCSVGMVLYLQRTCPHSMNPTEDLGISLVSTFASFSQFCELSAWWGRSLRPFVVARLASHAQISAATPTLEAFSHSHWPPGGIFPGPSRSYTECIPFLSLSDIRAAGSAMDLVTRDTCTLYYYLSCPPGVVLSSGRTWIFQSEDPTLWPLPLSLYSARGSAWSGQWSTRSTPVSLVWPRLHP